MHPFPPGLHIGNGCLGDYSHVKHAVHIDTAGSVGRQQRPQVHPLLATEDGGATADDAS
jgi:hypothetical protein